MKYATRATERFQAEIKEASALVSSDLRLDVAQKKLLAMFRRRIPRDQVQLFASLCRQAGIPDVGVRLLHPLVRPRKSRQGRDVRLASDVEKREYAACLTWLGSTEEAQGILKSLPPTDGPVNLIMGVNCFWAWDTERALAHFRKAAGHSGGEVTLPDGMEGWAAYWIACTYVQDVVRTAEAGAIYRKVIAFAQQNRSVRLEIYAWTGLLQALIQLKQWAEARAVSEQLGRLTAGRKHDQIMLRVTGYTLALDALEGRRKPGAAEFDAAVRALEGAGLWEDARGIRLFQLLAQRDDEGFLRLYFGTPHAGFRRRMRLLLEGQGYPHQALPPHYDFRVGPAGSAAGEEGDLLDSHTGRNSRGSGFLKPRQLVQRTLWVLISDFFQPQRTLEIFERLFPGEHVNPASSANRVQQSVLRLRRWLKGTGLSLDVREENGTYWLENPSPTRPLRIRLYADVPLQTEVTDPRVEEFLNRLRGHFGGRSFTSPEAAAVDGRPLRTVVRELMRAVESARLEKKGAGRATRYAIKA